MHGSEWAEQSKGHLTEEDAVHTSSACSLKSFSAMPTALHYLFLLKKYIQMMMSVTMRGIQDDLD